MITLTKEFYRTNKRAIQYVFFSILTAVLHVAVFYVSDLVLVSLILCNVIAYTFSILFSFFINKSVVFKNGDNNYVLQLLKYLVVKFSSFLIDTAVLLMLTHWLAFPNLLAKLIANCSTTFNNYILSKKFVFKNWLANNHRFCGGYLCKERASLKGGSY